jgi:hypothetical protein
MYRTETDPAEGQTILTSRMPGYAQIWCALNYLFAMGLVLPFYRDIRFLFAGFGFVAVHWSMMVAMGYSQHKYYKQLEEADR